MATPSDLSEETPEDDLAADIDEYFRSTDSMVILTWDNEDYCVIIDQERLDFIAPYHNAVDSAETWGELTGRQKTKAHQQLGEALSVNHNSLKNRRDDFDPLHGHRAGWHQYKLSEMMRNVVESF